MKKFVWLASYPKSGNTWMRALLTNYIQDGQQPAAINQLIGGPIASARFWFDEWAGIEASALSDDIIESIRPGVYRCMVAETHEPHFMKVHDAWKITDSGEALFPDDVTRAVIYIIRSPLDLAASCANHWGLSLDLVVDRLCELEFSLARSHGSLSDQLRQVLGSWSDHVSSWLDQSGLPCCAVRYEDLQQNPQKTLSRVVRFAGLDYDEMRIKKAAAFADFARLQGQEERDGFKERSVHSQGPFFRRGRVGGWRDELNEDQVQRLIASQGETMRRFGYLDQSGHPI